MNPTSPMPEGQEEMPQATRLDDVRIRDVRPLISPALLQYELPADEAVQAFIERSRTAVAQVVHGADARLLVVVGPCSIHDSVQAMQYASKLHALAGGPGGGPLGGGRGDFAKPRPTGGREG